MFAAAAIAAGLFFVASAFLTAATQSMRVVVVTFLLAFALGGAYTLLLVRRNLRLERANEQLGTDLRNVVIRESDLRTQVGYLLREPLASVVGDANILLGRPRTPADQQRILLESIRSNAREVEEMLDDLSRAGGNQVPTPDITSVVILDEEVRSIANSDPRAASIEIKCEPARAWGDPAKVRQILRTLVTLSTHTEGAQITVQTAQRGHVATATLSGKGTILPPDALAALSEDVDNAVALLNSDGTFETLRAAKNLAGGMGGTIASLFVFGESHIVLTLPAPNLVMSGHNNRTSASA
jgi:signal transduction histidine kinase